MSKKKPTARTAVPSAAEPASRRMTLAGFQREHDEVEHMMIEMKARKSTTLTNIRSYVDALEKLETKVEAIKLD